MTNARLDYEEALLENYEEAMLAYEEAILTLFFENKLGPMDTTDVHVQIRQFSSNTPYISRALRDMELSGLLCRVGYTFELTDVGRSRANCLGVMSELDENSGAVFGAKEKKLALSVLSMLSEPLPIDRYTIDEYGIYRLIDDSEHGEVGELLKHLEDTGLATSVISADNKDMLWSLTEEGLAQAASLVDVEE